jgi:hypothetical protein
MGGASAQTAPLFDLQGRRFDLRRWLQEQPAPGGRIGEAARCFPLAEKRPLPVRVMALRWSEKHRQAAQQHRRKKASHRGKRSTPPMESLSFAGWLIVVTILPSE